MPGSDTVIVESRSEIVVTGGDAPAGTALAVRSSRYAGAILVALALAVVISTVAGSGADAPGGRLGGDLPAFYGAGSIAADGDMDVLYDPARQIAAQADLWEEEGSFLYFAYPPFVATAYRVLVPFGYRGAYLIHTLLMAAALLGAVLLARPLVPWIGSKPLVPFVVAITFYPALRAVLGGQNSTFTLLLFVAVARWDRDGHAFISGVAAALLLYKPQFGVPLVLLLLVGKRWRALAGWALGASGLYLAGAFAAGASWIGDWWSQAIDFRDLNASVNGMNFISIPGVLEEILGDGSTVATAIGGLAVAAGAGAVAWVWWRLPDRPLLRIALAIATIVVIAPQSLFYEAALILLPVAILASGLTSMRPVVIGVIWGAGLLHLGAPVLDVSPLFVLPTVVVGWALVEAFRGLRERVPSV